MKKVQLLTKKNCLLCEEAEVLLETMQSIYSFTLEKVNIYEDEKLLERYQIEIPVVKIGEIELTSNDISFDTLSDILQASDEEGKSN